MDNLEQLQYWQKVESLTNEVNERLKEIEKKMDTHQAPDTYYKSSLHSMMQTMSNVQGILFLIEGNLKRGE